MALSKLVFKPGINKDQTNYASEGGWYDMDKVRFRSGFPEKIGGWTVDTMSAYAGQARSIFSWAVTDGGAPYAVGTNERIYVVAGGNLLNITPLRATFTTPSTDNCFTTTNASTTVTVTLTSHGAQEGDWVTFSGVVGFAGIPSADFNTDFKVFNVTATTFDITVATAATSGATGGGTAITAEFEVHIGYPINSLGYGWGSGPWGASPWGISTGLPINLPARLVFFDNFNNDLVFNIIGGDIYYWVYNTTAVSRAVLLSSLGGAVAVPKEVTQIHFTSQGYLLAMGCTNYDALGSPPDYEGDYDALLVRWSNVDPDIGPDPLNWQPELTNTAGFLRIQTGSKIITSISTRQETLIWTDTSLNSLQYLGTQEVFSLQQLSAHVSIIGPNAVIGANNVTYWMGNDKFYTYTGRVDTLPCTLRQYIFQDINRSQGSLVFAGSNVQFNEISWFYCTANSTEINRYVIYNYAENIWYYGQINRTAWVDSYNSFYPLAASNGWIYNHEDGTDDGQPNGDAALPIESYIQSADIDISDGDNFMLVRRVIPDVNFNGSTTVDPVTGLPNTIKADITVGVRNFPGAASSDMNVEGQTTTRTVITTATVDQYTNQVFIRARGRQMNFRIASDTVGTQWQLGMPRADVRPDGRRS